MGYPSNELNSPNPYVSAKIENEELVIELLGTFDSYEELETSLKFTMNIDFTCQRQTRQLVIHILYFSRILFPDNITNFAFRMWFIK